MPTTKLAANFRIDIGKPSRPMLGINVLAGFHIPSVFGKAVTEPG